MKSFDSYFSEADPLMVRLWQSGRELFHSNVLAYLLEDQRNSTNPAALPAGDSTSAPYANCTLEALTGESAWENFHVAVLREKLNMDLIVIALPRLQYPKCIGETLTQQYWARLAGSEKEWRLIAIENKFKSLPEAGQLRRYTGKILNNLSTPGRLRKLGLDDLQKHCGNPVQIGDAPAKSLRTILRWWLESQGLNDEGEEEQEPGAGQTRQAVNRETGAGAADEEVGPSATVPKISASSGSKGRLWRAYLQPSISRVSANTKSAAVEKTAATHFTTLGSTGWKGVSYQDLLRCIPTEAGAELATQFIAGYRIVCQGACEFHEQMVEELRPLPPAAPAPFSSFDAIRDQAKPFRLVDFVDKWRYSLLETAIAEKLASRSYFVSHGAPNLQPFLRRSSSGKGAEPAPSCIGRLEVENGRKAWVETYASFSRGTGMSGANLYPYDESPDGAKTPLPFNLGVQLQGGRLKLFVGFAGKLPEGDTRERTRLIDEGAEVLKRLWDCRGEIDWNVDEQTGLLKVGTYGGNQKVSLLDLNGSTLRVQDGRLIYYFADLWGAKPARPAEQSLDELAEMMVELICSVVRKAK